MACCCVAIDESIETSDLPAEPEHSYPGRLANIGRKPSLSRKGIDFTDLDDSPQHVEMMLGDVTIPPGLASQGLELLHSSKQNLLVVCGVTPGGPWDEWNQSHPENLVEPSDRILSINGKGEHMSKSEKSRNITLHIRKAAENHITVTKETGESMGMVLVPVANGLLFVDSIAPEGLVAAWNINNPDNAVKMGDMLVEVNGVRGREDVLLKAMAEGGDMELVIMTHVD